VSFLPRDAKVDDGKIPKTMKGISEQKIAILGGQTGAKYRHQVAVSKEMESLSAKKAEAMWTPSSPGSKDTFDTWARAKSAQAAGPLPPVAPTTKLNCWEMVMLSALRAGVTTWQWVHDLYSKGAQSADYQTLIMDALSRGARTPYDWHTRRGEASTTPRPNRGQVVFFDDISHVALATGQTKPTQQAGRTGSEVMSFWPPAAAQATLDSVKSYAIEDLAQGMSDNTKVEFSQPPW